MPIELADPALPNHRPLVVQMTTVPVSLNYYAGRAQYLADAGYEVVGVSSPGAELDLFGRREGVPIHPVPMRRSISPAADLRSLYQLVRLFQRLRPAIVHAHTPKADLLGSLAARMTGVSTVVVSLFGLPQMTQSGWRRWVLDSTTKIACRAADLVWCDSESMRRHVVEQRLATDAKVAVLARGSANGVDAADRFNPGRFSTEDRHALRQNVGIPVDATVLGFVGRVVGDKGIREMATSWRTLRERFPQTHLLLVGPWEEKDAVPEETTTALQKDPRVHIVGNQPDVPSHLAMMDLFLFPSYREGCPTAVLEASAMGLPVVTTDIPGCIDTVLAGETGTLAPVRDAEVLTSAVEAYLTNAELAHEHGTAGRRWVLEKFPPSGVWEAVRQAYGRLQGSLPTPRSGVAEQTTAGPTASRAA